MAFDGDSDDALLERIGASDQSAMRTLYERYQSQVTSFAAARLQGDRARAADVLHEVMLHVWRRPDSFGGRSSFKTWLLTLTRNKAIDRVRKDSRLEYGDEGEELIDGEPTPEVALATLQDERRVRTCVERLSSAHRSAIELTFFQGLSIADAADIEGVPAGTIKTRIFHAKKKLMACLGSADGSPGS